MNSLINTAGSEGGSDRTLQNGHSAECPIVRFIGVVGLGRMGEVIAVNLVEDGHRVLAFDRNPARAAALATSGVEAVSSLLALSACDVVITFLPDDAALSAVARSEAGLLDSLNAGAVHICMSTVSPGIARELAAEHTLLRQHYVAAPVLGNPDLARERKLFVLAAGDSKGLEIAQPLLKRLGQRLFPLGEDAGAANLMKLAGNVLTALTLQSMGEVLALLRKHGVDPRSAFDVLTKTLFDSRVHRAYGGKIVEERYSPPGMTVPLAIKDLRLALAEAEREAVPMPAASLVHDRLVALVAAGDADLDWSALGLLAARDAGLTSYSDKNVDHP